jgi:hypothetical protein
VLIVVLPGCRFDASGLGPDRAVISDVNGRREARVDLAVDLAERDARRDVPLLPDAPVKDAPPHVDLRGDQPRQDVPSQDLPGQDLPGQDLLADLQPDQQMTSDLRFDTNRTPDLPKPDTRPPDLPKPDTRPPDTKALKSCDDIYSTASGYILCKENPTSCEFNANTSPNCATLCSSFSGQTCLGAYDNPNTAGQECDHIGTDSCSTNRGTEICVCSRN